jgi:hypothetical protein
MIAHFVLMKFKKPCFPCWKISFNILNSSLHLWLSRLSKQTPNPLLQSALLRTMQSRPRHLLSFQRTWKGFSTLESLLKEHTLSKVSLNFEDSTGRKPVNDHYSSKQLEPKVYQRCQWNGFRIVTPHECRLIKHASNPVQTNASGTST